MDRSHHVVTRKQPQFNVKRFALITDPLISVIQKELHQNIKQLWTGTRAPGGFSFNASRVDRLMDLCPTLMSFLKTHGLDDKIANVAYPLVQPRSTSGLHMDGYELDCIGSHGLNLPVFNCDGTYTVYYTTPNFKSSVLISTTGRVAEDVSTRVSVCSNPEECGGEIDRVEVANAYWHNGNFAHRAVNPTNRERMITTIRFTTNISHLFL
jgi:hypothetical protein